MRVACPGFLYLCTQLESYKITIGEGLYLLCLLRLYIRVNHAYLRGELIADPPPERSELVSDGLRLQTEQGCFRPHSGPGREREVRVRVIVMQSLRGWIH